MFFIPSQLRVWNLPMTPPFPKVLHFVLNWINGLINNKKDNIRQNWWQSREKSSLFGTLVIVGTLSRNYNKWFIITPMRLLWLFSVFWLIQWHKSGLLMSSSFYKNRFNSVDSLQQLCFSSLKIGYKDQFQLSERGVCAARCNGGLHVDIVARPQQAKQQLCAGFMGLVIHKCSIQEWTDYVIQSGSQNAKCFSTFTFRDV